MRCCYSIMTAVKKINNKDKKACKEIFSIFQRSYKEEAGLLNVQDFPPLERQEADISDSTAEFHGLYEKKDLIALVETELDVKGVLQIHSLVVDPGFFRKGNAEKMICWLRDTYSWSRIEVVTAEENFPAISLYEKLGFRKSRTWLTAEGIQLALFELTNLQ